MPTDNDTNTSTDETSGQEAQGQQQSTTSETGENGTQQQASTEPIKLPDDHPLVKSLAAQKLSIASQKTEITELRATSKKATQMEADLAARPTAEAVETLQTRYDRLEAFLQSAGGPLGKALDSRTFTKALFETDESITDIVKTWNAANPSATSTALGSSAAAPGSKKPDMNALLRSALK